MITASCRLRTLRLRLVAAVAALGLLAGTAAAQTAVPLERLAPPDAILALGLTPGGLPDGDLQAAFEALDTEAAATALEALVEVFGELDGAPMGMAPMGGMGFMLDDALDMAGDIDPSELGSELETQCPGLEEDATSFLETDDWARDLLLSVAWDPFSSIPGGVALARVDAGAVPAAQALYGRLVDCFGSEPLGSAEGVTLDLVGDGGDLPLVLASTGDLFIVGTQPELVRAVLSRNAGSGDPSLADRPGAFLDGATGVRLYYDLAAIADTIASVAPIPQDDPSVTAVLDRVLGALRTAGHGSLRTSATERGIEAEMHAFPDPDGGDAELYGLLTCAGCEAPDASWAIGDAVSVEGSAFDPTGWVDWLDGLAADVTEAAMGAPMTLRGLLLDEAGLDLDLLLLDWLGGSAVTSQLATISTDLRDLVSMPAATIVSVRSPAAAEAGLDAIEAAIAELAASVAGATGDLADLQDVVDQIAIRHGEIAGTPFRRFQISATTDLRVAVVGDVLVAATTEDAFLAALGVLDGSVPSGVDSEGWAAIEAASSGRIASWRYGDGGAPLRGLTDLLELAAQPAAAGLAAAAQAALEQDAYAIDDSGFGESAEQPLIDLAMTSGYDGPQGIAGAATADLAYGVPVDGAIGPDTPTFDMFDAIDLYRLPTVEPGTEVSVVMTSGPLDTYLYLYDAQTGMILAENDDAPWTDRSEIRFLSDGRDLLVGATTWSGSGEGSYQIEAVLADAPEPVAEPEPTPAEEEAEVEAPSFAELLPLTELLPEAVGIIAERLGLSWSVTTHEDGQVSSRSLQRVTW